MPDVPQNIPPQVLQALQQQQQGMSGGDITSILAQLAQMSPDELSAALQQLGVNISPQQLVGAAENWLEDAADKQTATSDEADTEADPEGADRTRGINPADQEEVDEGEPAPAPVGEEEAEGEGDTIPANATPTGYSPQPASPAAAMANAVPPSQVPQGAPPMAPSAGGRLPPAAAMRGAAAGGGGTMDDLVSAAIMQQAAGNPNAAVPLPRMRGPKPPGPGVTPTSLGNIRQRGLSTRSRKRG